MTPTIAELVLMPASNNRLFHNFASGRIYLVIFIVKTTSVARLQMPRVNPYRWHKFHREEEFFTGEEIFVTPLIAFAPRRSRPLRGRGVCYAAAATDEEKSTDEQTNEQTNR